MNVVLTPHRAGTSDRGTCNVKWEAAENVAHYLDGRWPESVGSPVVREHLRLRE